MIRRCSPADIWPTSLSSEMCSLHEFERGVSASAHLGRDVQVGPERGGGEKSGDDGVDTARDTGALARQVRLRRRRGAGEAGRHPIARGRAGGCCVSGVDDGIALAGDGLDQRGFSAAVGTEDGDVLSSGDAEADVVEHDGFATGYVDVLHVEKFGFSLGDLRAGGSSPLLIK